MTAPFLVPDAPKIKWNSFMGPAWTEMFLQKYYIVDNKICHSLSHHLSITKSLNKFSERGPWGVCPCSVNNDHYPLLCQDDIPTDNRVTASSNWVLSSGNNMSSQLYSRKATQGHSFVIKFFSMVLDNYVEGYFRVFFEFYWEVTSALSLSYLGVAYSSWLCPALTTPWWLLQPGATTPTRREHGLHLRWSRHKNCVIWECQPKT